MQNHKCYPDAAPEYVGRAKVNYIDLFSGIGGFALGAYWAGMHFEHHYFSEIEPYRVELYQKRFPDAIPLGDIRNHEEWKLEPGEYIITGGFPCQPFSWAGRRKQEKDPRNLWPCMRRVVRRIRPLWVVAENVAGSTGYIKNVVLPDLDAADYEAWPIGISAAAMGAPHIRERIWILAHSNSKRQPQSNGAFGEIRGRLVNRGGNMAYADSQRSGGQAYEICAERDAVERSGAIVADTTGERQPHSKGGCSIEQFPGRRSVDGADWENVEYIDCTDGYFRPVKPGVCLLVDGLPGTVVQLEAFGDAIVPQIAELLWRQIKSQI